MPADNGKRPYAWDQVPGPGTYQVNCDNRSSGYMGDAPSFSLQGRKGMPKPEPASPGPVYSPRAAGHTGDAVSFSFGAARKELGVDRSPGPGNYSATLDKRGTSSIGGGASGAKYGFGTSPQRENAHSPRGRPYISKRHAQSSNFGMGSPGPMLYNLPDGMGRESVDGRIPNSPRFSMRPRLPDYNTGSPPNSARAPGPGTYKLVSAFGPQQRSELRSAGCYSFGFSDRGKKVEPYQGKEFDKLNFGVHSPGPMRYKLRNTLGAESTNGATKYANTPSYTFGTEDRFCY